MDITRNKKKYEICLWDVSYAVQKRFREIRLKKLAKEKAKRAEEFQR